MRLLTAALAAMAGLLLLSGPVQAQDWHRAETAHFIVKSRDSAEATRAFAATMELYDRNLRFLMGLPEDHVEASKSNKPVIYRFGDNIDISRTYDRGDAGLAGFFIGRAGASVAFAPARYTRSNSTGQRTDRTQSIEQVLLHEYTHYFMLMNYPAAYPRWYSEGYAEMMSTMRFLPDGRFHLGDPPQARGWIIADMPLSRLDEMLDDDRQLTGYAAFQHYASGWLFAHYLSFNPDREAKLREFLAALGQGEDSLTAARRIFGDLDAMQRELVRYRRGPFPGYDVRPNVTTPVQVTVTPMSPEEEALVVSEYTLAAGVTPDEARDVARRLRTLVQTYPDSGWAHTLLAEAEHDSKNYPAGEAAAARAVELDPTNIRAWVYRAYNAIEMGKTDPAQFDLARAHLQRARRLDAEDPRPLIAYYRSYYEQTGGANIPEQAIVALEQAMDESGNDFEFRILLGRQLAMEERFAEARTVLLPSLYGGHAFEQPDEEDEFTPERLFAALDAQDRTRALEMLNKLLEPDDDET
ncbi:MAG: hypothetical protein ABIT10_05320 [Alteraurantiacibacter sp.]